jgi:hypothetical protein
MSLINERHIDTQRAGDAQGAGNFASLMDFMNRREVRLANFTKTPLTVNGQFAYITAPQFAGKIAVGTTSGQTTGGYQAAALSTAVGTAATTSITDPLGNVTNVVDVRDATTHDPIINGDGRKVYALLQSDVGAADGADVGATGSENLQISFVVINADGTMVLENLSQDIHLALPRLFASRHIPEYVKSGANLESEVIQPVDVVTEPNIAYYDVTSAFQADEVVDLTGVGAGTGGAVHSGDTLTSIGSTATVFNEDNEIFVRINGTVLRKGTEVV